jgi:hypothetical protein
MMDIEQPMIHIRLYREGGRYVESVDISKKEKEKKKRKYIYNTNEQPSILGVPDFKKGLGL